METRRSWVDPTPEQAQALDAHLQGVRPADEATARERRRQLAEAAREFAPRPRRVATGR
jgi:hypothetical protein